MGQYNRHVLTFDEFAKLPLDSWNSGEGAKYLSKLSSDFPNEVVLGEDINGAFYVKKGSLSVKINDREIKVSKGELFLLLPNNDLEYLLPDINYQGNVIIVSTNLMLELTGEVELYRYMLYLQENSVIKLPEENESLINSYLNIIDSKFENQKKTKRDFIAVNYLFHCLVIEVFNVLSLIDETSYMQRHNVFKRFMEMMSTLNIHNHSVEWYASRLNVTAKYLSEICRKSSGRPASSWIKEYSIIDIKQNLRDESRSIKEVAFALGYPNLSFFGKCVRRWFGMSPTALRAKLKQ